MAGKEPEKRWRGSFDGWGDEMIELLTQMIIVCCLSVFGHTELALSLIYIDVLLHKHLGQR